MIRVINVGGIGLRQMCNLFEKVNTNYYIMAYKYQGADDMSNLRIALRPLISSTSAATS